MKPIKSTSLLPMILQSIGIGIIGILFPVAYIFLPMIFLTEAIDKGLVKIMGTFLGLCLFLELLIPKLGMTIFTLFGPLILILHYCLVTKKDFERTFSLASGIFVISIMLTLQSTGVLDFIRQEDFPQKLIAMQKEAGIWQEGMEAYLPTFENVMRKGVQYLPGLVVIISLLVTYLTMTFTGRKLLLRGKLVVQPSSFFYFRLPKGLLFVMALFSLGAAAFSKELSQSAPLLVNNGILVAGFLFFVQGLAVMDFLFIKLKILRIFKTILLVMIVFTPIVQIPIAFLGLCDSIFNLRRIHIK